MLRSHETQCCWNISVGLSPTSRDSRHRPSNLTRKQPVTTRSGSRAPEDTGHRAGVLAGPEQTPPPDPGSSVTPRMLSGRGEAWAARKQGTEGIPGGTPRGRSRRGSPQGSPCKEGNSPPSPWGSLLSPRGGDNGWTGRRTACLLREHHPGEKRGLMTHRVLMEPSRALLRPTNAPTADRFWWRKRRHSQH